MVVQAGIKRSMCKKADQVERSERSVLATRHCGFPLRCLALADPCNINCYFLQKLKQTDWCHIKLYAFVVFIIMI